MSIGDIYAVHIDFIGAGMPDPGSCNIHYQVFDGDDGLTPAQEAESIGLALSGDVTTPLLAICPTSVQLLGYRVRGVTTPSVGYDSPVDLAGTDSLAGAAQLPASIARVVSLKSGLIGRRYNGRIYLPPTGEVNWDAPAQWSSGYGVNIETFMDALSLLTDTVNAYTYGLTVWSDTYSISSPVTSWIIRGYPGNVRRRVK